MTKRIPKAAIAHYRNGEFEILNKNGGILSHEPMSRDGALGRFRELISSGRMVPYGTSSGELIAINPVHVKSVRVIENSTHAMVSFENNHGALIREYAGDKKKLDEELNAFAMTQPLYLPLPGKRQAVSIRAVDDVDNAGDELKITGRGGEILYQGITSRSDESLISRKMTEYGKLLTEEKRLAESAKSEDNKLPPFLKHFAIDLTAEARKGKLDEIKGRDKEIERVAAILNRDKKANPTLIGPAGAGKTAIVENLAIKIARNDPDLPEHLRGKTIVQLAMNTMVAGTMLRGMFEDRIQNVIRELKEHQDDMILFVDELHTIVGAGSALGAPSDAAQVFKTSLANGDFRMISATTLNEFDEFIEKDDALARRLQKVVIDDLTWEQTREGFLKRAADLARKFEVQAPVEVLDTILSDCEKLDGSSLIDRAIDVLDETMARVDMKGGAAITVADARQTIALKFNKPVFTIGRTDAEIIKDVGAALDKRVIGQPVAKQRVLEALKRYLSGVGNPDQPMGTMIFVGASGIGKTELAEALAEGLGYNYVYLDMTRFKGENSDWNLIGSPRGIVGNEKKGELTGPVHEHPFSVVMADEIDKADRNLQYIFMQAADKGELKDNRGRTANFRNAILIFAGNFNVRDTRAVGFKEPVVAEKGGQQNLPAQVSAFFVPAMLGRADVIKFSTLTREQVAEIADKFVAEREEWIARKKRMHVDISLTEEAKYRLADLSNSNDTGARELDRVMRYHVDTQLADKIIAGELRDGGTAVVDVDAVTHKFNVAVAGGPPVQPGAAVAPYSANGTPRPSLN